ncbi:MAG TPA: type II toxin-antitoxin system VapC family toxin, partial [Candidatus Kapabacteria bacterium]
RRIILLDTHVWVWSVVKHPNLSVFHAGIIERERNNLAISIVTCWEISTRVSKGRLQFPTTLREWFDYAIAESSIAVLPLTPLITMDAYDLPGTFHDGPADRMIVVTARNREIVLLTEDKKILNYSHVQTA